MIIIIIIEPYTHIAYEPHSIRAAVAIIRLGRTKVCAKNEIKKKKNNSTAISSVLFLLLLLSFCWIYFYSL